MKNNTLIQEWLRRAKSNLERAKAGKVSEGMLYEDLCFDCQQAVEKSLKALLIYKEVEFPWVHSISKLMELVEDSSIDIPDQLKDAVTLTDYAVDTRYPGDYEPVDEEMYKEALEIAEKVVSWVETRLEDDAQKRPEDHRKI